MKFDSTKRRKRQYRVSTGARHQITPRDIEIFRLLQRYRFLRTRQIRALLPDELRGRSDKRFRERLGFLFHEGYLGRPKQQRLNLNFYYTDSIYELDDRGAALMDAIGLGQADGLVLGGAGAGRQFAHAMMIVDSLVAIELGVRADADTAFVDWSRVLQRVPAATRRRANPMQLPQVTIDYRLRHSGRTHGADVALIPDAIFAIKYPAGYLLYLLEAEHHDVARRTTLRENSFLRKVLAYRALRRRKLFEPHFGTNAIVVLVVALSLARIDSCLAIVNDVTDGRGSAMFAFHDVPVFAETLRANPQFPSLYAAPWLRAGHAPLRLDTAS